MHGDPDAPQQPRLGVVSLNLAEYADKDAVTRRYLLRESKTNATLQVPLAICQYSSDSVNILIPQLTIELQHIGGEKQYNAPPLQKGEVMAEVATLLERSPYGTLPRPAYSRKASAANSSANLPPRTQGKNAPALLATSSLQGSTLGSAGGSRSRVHSPAPNLDGLDPLVAGTGSSLRTTDNIIEAIFNPVPTSSTAPSPFTYYVPPRSRLTPIVVSNADTEGSIGSKSIDADADAPHSATSANTSQSFSLLDQRIVSQVSDNQSTKSGTESQATTSTSKSSSTNDDPTQTQGRGRRWWQKFAGGGLKTMHDSRPSSPNRTGAQPRHPDHSHNFPVSQAPEPHRAKTPDYQTSFKDSNSSSSSAYERDPGVQIVIRRATSREGDRSAVRP